MNCGYSTLEIAVHFVDGASQFVAAGDEDPNLTFEPLANGKELFPEANPVRILTTPEQEVRFKSGDVETVVTCRRCAVSADGACRSEEHLRELFVPEVSRSQFKLDAITHTF
jgi:hypothetical protein